MKPPQLVIDFLVRVADFIPYAPIAPIPDIIDKCFKTQEAIDRVRGNELGYFNKPRLRSCVAMMRATEDIDRRMSDLSHPCLILHGDADTVTSPTDSQILYNRCSSIDKKLILYPGCWHDLLHGESEEQSKIVFNDIVNWISQRL